MPYDVTGFQWMTQHSSLSWEPLYMQFHAKKINISFWLYLTDLESLICYLKPLCQDTPAKAAFAIRCIHQEAIPKVLCIFLLMENYQEFLTISNLVLQHNKISVVRWSNFALVVANEIFNLLYRTVTFNNAYSLVACSIKYVAILPMRAHVMVCCLTAPRHCMIQCCWKITHNWCSSIVLIEQVHVAYVYLDYLRKVSWWLVFS